MSHPFGELLTQFRTRRRGYSQARLAELAGYHPTVVAKMCQGRKELTGPSGRERVVRLIDTLHEQALLTTLNEANALLKAAGMPPLFEGAPDELALMRQLKSDPTPDDAHKLDAAPNTRHATNLPAQLTKFVGRVQQMADIVDRIQARHRLVTLAGAGGVGKTRLAIEIGTSLVGATGRSPRQRPFPDGVWLVDLAPISDPNLLHQTVMAVFDLPEQVGRAPLDALMTFLAHKHLLLILDNCEHLIGSCAEMAERLLGACPGLHILATSREALRIAGEVTWRVPSLATPDPARLPVLDEVLHYEAIELFINHATALQPAFALTPVTIVAIARICHTLDGIPLAIEMAAAQVAVLSVGEIAVALRNRFELLTSGQRTALPRHQTLRAVLDWSYALLSEPERVLLARLSVFAGGWTADTANAVCPAKGDEDHVLPVLYRLVHKSLVVAAEYDGQTRYHLLETVRQYAAEVLHVRRPAEEAPLRDRHLAYFLALAEERPVYGRQYATWLRRMDAELDNVRAAVAWALDQSKMDRGERPLRLAGALEAYYLRRGHLNECSASLEQALACSVGAPVAARARAIRAKAHLLAKTIDYRAALPLAKESLMLYRQLDDPIGFGWALLTLQVVAQNYEFDLRRALGLAESALELFRAAGDLQGTMAALHSKGGLLGMQGNDAACAATLKEAFLIAERIGFAWDIGDALQWLYRVQCDTGLALWQRALVQTRKAGEPEWLITLLSAYAKTLIGAGDYARAAELARESLVLAQHHGQGQRLRARESEAYFTLAMAEYYLGQWDAALQHLQASHDIERDFGEPPLRKAQYCYYFACIAMARIDLTLAERHTRDAMSHALDSSLTVEVALVLALQGELARLQGDAARAARLIGAAARWDEEVKAVWWPVMRIEYERTLANVQEWLRNPELMSAWAEGQAMTREEAVQYARAD